MRRLTLSQREVYSFRQRVLAWADDGLRSYSWRKGDYHQFAFLVTEILLARTRADSAERVADRVLQVYPDARTLSQAQIELLEELIRPLGLQHKRSRALVKLGRILVDHYDGEVPQDLDTLLSLPYVGRYAANAVLCFAFGRPRPVVDTNVARLLRRHFDLEPPAGKLANNEDYWDLAERLLPEENVRTYNWAMLDLGAVVCKPLGPLCSQCPLVDTCLAHCRHRCVESDH